MTQPRSYPLEEQVAADGSAIYLARLDGIGFAELERRNNHLPRQSWYRHGTNEPFGQDTYEVSIAGTRHLGSAGFDRSGILVGSVRSTLGLHRIIICRAKKRKMAERLLNGTPGMLGLIFGDDIHWVGPDHDDVFLDPFAAHLLDAVQREPMAEVSITHNLTTLLAGIGHYTRFRKEDQTAYLVGPIVIEVVDHFGEYRDTDKIRFTSRDDEIRGDYYSPGLDPDQLATYAGLRRSGLSVEDAEAAALLISA